MRRGNRLVHKKPRFSSLSYDPLTFTRNNRLSIGMNPSGPSYLMNRIALHIAFNWFRPVLGDCQSILNLESPSAAFPSHLDPLSLPPQPRHYPRSCLSPPHPRQQSRPSSASGAASSRSDLPPLPTGALDTCTRSCQRCREAVGG